jgi:dTMP kinase
VYTAFGRDVARGVDSEWVRAVYSFAPKPDLAIYFRVPIEVSLQRILSGRTKLKYHEAGMDLGLSRDPAESFRLFQSRVLVIYDELVQEFGLEVIDATADISQQQQQVRQLAAAVLKLGERAARARRG